MKSILRLYYSDGINLWDRSSGYDKAADKNLPAPGTASYPRFIKTLREALGWGTLITLADEGVPTESFHSTDLSGGIAPGEYLDYAWAANINMQNIPVVDPYHQGAPGVSTDYPRHPIAGLPQERYGCIFFTLITKDGCDSEVWSDRSSQDIGAWVSAGLRNNNIVVFNDIFTCIQNTTEDTISNNSNVFEWLVNDEKEQYDFDKICLTTKGQGSTGYDEWKKDW